MIIRLLILFTKEILLSTTKHFKDSCANYKENLFISKLYSIKKKFFLV